MTQVRDRLYKASLSVLLFFSVFVALGQLFNGKLFPAFLFFISACLFVQIFFKYKVTLPPPLILSTISCLLLWVATLTALNPTHTGHQPLLLYAFFPLSMATFLLLGMKRSGFIVLCAMTITIYQLAQNYHLAILYQALSLGVFWGLLCVLFSYTVSLEKKLEQAITIDPLTGCSTISQFKKQFEAITTLHRRYRNSLTCLRFKATNHAESFHEKERYYGEVAQIFQSRIRQTDIICHYSQGYFLILLPNTDLENAEILATDLVQACKAYTFSDAEGTKRSVARFDYELSSYNENHSWEAWFSEVTDTLTLTNQ